MKTIRVRINNDGSVRVSADTAVSLEIIQDFLNRNSGWIVQHVKETEKAQQKQELRDGARLRIFGETYVLRLKEIDADEAETAEDEKGNLTLYTKDTEDQPHITALVTGFIAKRGREVLDSYYRLFLSRSGYKGEPPELILKLLSGKWGHCDYKNNQIMLNFALCGLPEELIRYVTAHEVTHLLVANHSKDFYSAGEIILPGFREFDKVLRKYKAALWQNMIVDS